MPRSVDLGGGPVYPAEDGFLVPSDAETARLKAGRAAASVPTALSDFQTSDLPAHSLGGDLRTMILADVLLWVATRRKSGTLHVQRRSTRKRLVFQEGVIHSSSSNDPRETLGQFLVRDGLVTEEQLFKALLQQEEKGSLLGILLVSDGLLTADQLKRALRAKAEQIIYDLFLWSEGSFFFQEGLLPRNVPMNLEMDSQAVVKEGTRRRRRWLRIRDKFPSSEITFKVETKGQPPEHPVERRIFDLAAQGMKLAEISLQTRRSEFDTAEYLFALVELGVLAVDRVLPEAEAADAVGTIEALLALARAAVEEKRYDAAFEAYQDVLALDHLNQEAKKGLLAVSDGRKRQRTARRVPPNAVPVVLMPPSRLTQEKFNAEEGFVLSRINGRWDVQSILKLCPVGEEGALAIFARLVDRKVIELK